MCNGFGQCQCRPPFITEDCAVKDCAGNCSGHGWCSVEYPVSRCMCDPKYFGDLCEHKLCLNNCSWPNGDCILSEGTPSLPPSLVSSDMSCTPSLIIFLLKAKIGASAIVPCDTIHTIAMSHIISGPEPTAHGLLHTILGGSYNFRCSPLL